jgi:hypothetical protein
VIGDKTCVVTDPANNLDVNMYTQKTITNSHLDTALKTSRKVFDRTHKTNVEISLSPSV